MNPSPTPLPDYWKDIAKRLQRVLELRYGWMEHFFDLGNLTWAGSPGSSDKFHDEVITSLKDQLTRLVIIEGIPTSGKSRTAYEICNNSDLTFIYLPLAFISFDKGISDLCDLARLVYYKIAGSDAGDEQRRSGNCVFIVDDALLSNPDDDAAPLARVIPIIKSHLATHERDKVVLTLQSLQGIEGQEAAAFGLKDTEVKEYSLTGINGISRPSKLIAAPLQIAITATFPSLFKDKEFPTSLGLEPMLFPRIEAFESNITRLNKSIAALARYFHQAGNTIADSSLADSATLTKLSSDPVAGEHRPYAFILTCDQDNYLSFASTSAYLHHYVYGLKGYIEEAIKEDIHHTSDLLALLQMRLDGLPKNRFLRDRLMCLCIDVMIKAGAGLHWSISNEDLKVLLDAISPQLNPYTYATDEITKMVGIFRGDRPVVNLAIGSNISQSIKLREKMKHPHSIPLGILLCKSYAPVMVSGIRLTYNGNER